MKNIVIGMAMIFAVFSLAVSCSKAAKEEAKAPPAAEAPAAKKAPVAPVNFWENWPRGTVGQFPPCGTNVIALGLDEILQATVDIYCGLDPGAYETKINPAAMDVYKAKGTEYPDGITGILLLPKLGVGFITTHSGGKPIMDAITLADSVSIASSDAGHPLNPDVCFKCHNEFDGACQGWVCGNRND